MKHNHRKTNLLTIAILILLIIGTSISLYTLYYAVQNRGSFQTEVQQNLRQELAKLDIPTKKDITIDEAKLVLAIAEYCQANNDCRGRDGDSLQGLIGNQGIQGAQGLQGLTGAQGQPGVSGVDGIDGEDGTDGANGVDGKTPLLRCNTDKNRWEVHYSDTDNWTIVRDQDDNPVKCTVVL